MLQKQTNYKSTDYIWHFGIIFYKTNVKLETFLSSISYQSQQEVLCYRQDQKLVSPVEL